MAGEILPLPTLPGVCPIEAAVGGGIPADSTPEEVVECQPHSCCYTMATTNYIPTAMQTEGRDFADVLAVAQQLGYAGEPLM